MKRVLSLAIVLMLAFSCVFTAFAQTDDTASPDEAKKVTELKITKLPDKLTYTSEDVIEPDIDLSKNRRRKCNRRKSNQVFQSVQS